MKPASGDGHNKSTETEWPCALKHAGEEFQQSYAVAQLAVKLCELKKASSKTAAEKENLEPDKFLAEAWDLIEKARERVLRSETNAEYLLRHGGSYEADENVVGRILSESRIPFEKLCDAKRSEGDSDQIRIETFSPEGKEETICVHWKVYTTEKAFDNLFWAYWRDTSIFKLRTIVSASEVLGNEPDKWEHYGGHMLALWKRDGVPANDFLALARFRSERDNRSENLKKKPKTKRRRLTAKARA